MGRKKKTESGAAPVTRDDVKVRRAKNKASVFSSVQMGFTNAFASNFPAESRPKLLKFFEDATLAASHCAIMGTQALSERIIRRLEEGPAPDLQDKNVFLKLTRDCLAAFWAEAESPEALVIFNEFAASCTGDDYFIFFNYNHLLAK